jgi:hypothetical protein
MLIACAFGALLWSGEACEWDGAHPDRAQVQNRTGTRWIEISSSGWVRAFLPPWQPPECAVTSHAVAKRWAVAAHSAR